jgi:hypothetical protein
MAHAGITVTADTHADEQFDSIAVRLTRWLTFRQTPTRSYGPNLAPSQVGMATPPAPMMRCSPA